MSTTPAKPYVSVIDQLAGKGFFDCGGPTERLQQAMLEKLEAEGTINGKELRALRKLRGEQLEDE